MKKFVLSLVALGFMSVLGSAVAQTPTTVTLKSGEVKDVIILSVGSDHITWSPTEGSGGGKLKFSVIDGIEFSHPQFWTDALNDYRSGNYQQAVDKFKKISLAKAGTFYPAPGNFNTMAHIRLIDCYRKLHSAFDVGYIYERTEWDKVPSSEKANKDVLACWAATGTNRWDDALEEIAETSKKLDWTDPLRGELAYVRALVHIGKKSPPDAVVAFGEAYGAYPGVDIELSADALKQAVKILATYPDRKEEMHSLIHVYANLYGDGKLWENAAPDVLALVSKPIEGMGVGGPGKNKNTNKVTRARYVRIELGGSDSLSLVEVEVMSGESNIASSGKPTADSADGGRGALRAIDGNKSVENGAGSTFVSKATDERSWFELDLGSSQPIDSIVVWTHPGKVGLKTKGFDLVVLSDDRKSVYESRDTKEFDRRIAFDIKEGVVKATPGAVAKKPAPKKKAKK